MLRWVAGRSALPRCSYLHRPYVWAAAHRSLRRRGAYDDPRLCRPLAAPTGLPRNFPDMSAVSNPALPRAQIHGAWCAVDRPVSDPEYFWIPFQFQRVRPQLGEAHFWSGTVLNNYYAW